MSAVLYRWRVTKGREAEFEQAWLEGTRLIEARCDSHGARLHRAEDGTYWSYARWPGEAARKACFAQNEFFSLPCFRTMQNCIEERFDTVVLEVRADALAEPQGEPGEE